MCMQDLAKEDGADDRIQVQDAVKELEKQRKEMEEIPSTQLLDKTKRLRQACFKASYRKRHQRAYTNDNSSNIICKGNANTQHDPYSECQQAHTIDHDISIMTYTMQKSTLIPTSNNISRSSLLSKTTPQMMICYKVYTYTCHIPSSGCNTHYDGLYHCVWGSSVINSSQTFDHGQVHRILPYRDNLIFY